MARHGRNDLRKRSLIIVVAIYPVGAELRPVPTLNGTNADEAPPYSFPPALSTPITASPEAITLPILNESKARSGNLWIILG